MQTVQPRPTLGSRGPSGPARAQTVATTATAVGGRRGTPPGKLPVCPRPHQSPLLAHSTARGTPPVTRRLWRDLSGVPLPRPCASHPLSSARNRLWLPTGNVGGSGWERGTWTRRPSLRTPVRISAAVGRLVAASGTRLWTPGSRLRGPVVPVGYCATVPAAAKDVVPNWIGQNGAGGFHPPTAMGHRTKNGERENQTSLLGMPKPASGTAKR